MSALERRHATYVGWVCGIARTNGVALLPVIDDAGNYTNELALSIFPPGTQERIRVVFIVPPPPDDWGIE